MTILIAALISCAFIGIFGGILIYPRIAPEPTSIVFEKTSSSSSPSATNIPTKTIRPKPTATPTLRPTRTITPPKPTVTPKTILQPVPANYQCPDKDIIELQIGAWGKIGKYDVSLRKNPVVPDIWDANIIRVLETDERIKVLDGPRCSHDGTWWQVQTESSQVGWVREMVPSKGRLIIRIEP